MKYLASFSSLFAALCLGIPATGFSDDHHGGHGSSGHGGNYNGHGGNYYGHGGSSHGHYYYGGHRGYGRGYYPYFSAYPYYAAPYYGGYYDDGDYASPTFGLSISSSSTYRGARVDNQGGSLSLDVQRALRREGYYRGSIDGDIGAGTRAAIRQYQYDNHLEVTGRIDRSLLHSLDLD